MGVRQGASLALPALHVADRNPNSAQLPGGTARYRDTCSKVLFAGVMAPQGRRWRSVSPGIRLLRLGVRGGDRVESPSLQEDLLRLITKATIAARSQSRVLVSPAQTANLER